MWCSTLNCISSIRPATVSCYTHGWVSAWTRRWIRIVPLLAGILLIPVGWALARLLWPDHLIAGDVAAILIATSPYMLHYSQDVTTYSWTSLWVALSFLLLVAAWRTDGLWLWAGWAISLAVSLYSHYFALFPLLVAGLGVLVLGLRDDRPGHRRLWHALAAIVVAVLLYAPWLWQLFANGGQALGIVFFPLTLDSQAFHWVPVLMAGYAHAPFWQSGWGALVAWCALALCAAWAIWRLYGMRNVEFGMRNNDRSRRSEFRIPNSTFRIQRAALGIVLIVGWFVAAITGPYLFLRITSPPGSVDPVRFATMAVPALLVGLAAMVAFVRPAWRVVLLAGWLLLVAWQWRAELLSPPTQDWRGILATVRQQAQPGDVVLAFPAFHAAAATAYYPANAPVQGGWFVAEGSDPAGAAFWFPPGWQWNGFLNSDAHRSTDWTDEIKARTDGAKRIWYLAGDGVDGTYPPSPTAERTLAALGWQPAGEWRDSPLVLTLYTRGGE